MTNSRNNRPATRGARAGKSVAFRLSLAGLLALGGMLAEKPVAFAQAVNANTLLAKAQADECFVAVGSAANLFPALSLLNPPQSTCASGSPKVNQAYVWGLAKSGSNLWFGTAPNVECLVLSGYMGITTPVQTPSYVCEFGQSNFKPGGKGTDWRPPQVWVYSLADNKLTNRSTDPAVAAVLNGTMGLRSAGSLGNIVFLAGPALNNTSINLLAFNNKTGQFLGAQNIAAYNNIRQWVVMNGYLYTGVRANDGTGRVLRWVGSAADPFKFVEVGKTNADVAYLTVLNNRLYASTWGGGNVSLAGGPPSGVWVGPATTAALPASSAMWTEIWNVAKYEVDQPTIQTLAGGAIEAYNGKIYWGMMQVPLTGLLAHYKAYPAAPRETADMLQALVNTTRPIPIFRSDGNPNPAQTRINLLYGSRQLAKWNGSAWVNVVNAGNLTPVFGAAGFGNPFNTYAWASAVYNKKLYFGTFDWYYLLADGLPQIAKALGVPLPAGTNYQAIVAALAAAAGGSNVQFGADLWRFDSPALPAKAESLNGLGNYLNYGVRTMLVGGGNLYVGTANPMNLKTGKGQPNGGWELRKLTTKSLW